MPGPEEHTVVLYARPGCHLCDVAREAVLALRQRAAFAFEEIDIERDETLELEYGIRIPVLEVDGEERFEGIVDVGELAALVNS
jgi:glutaredoxin